MPQLDLFRKVPTQNAAPGWAQVPHCLLSRRRRGLEPSRGRRRQFAPSQLPGTPCSGRAAVRTGPLRVSSQLVSRSDSFSLVPTFHSLQVLLSRMGLPQSCRASMCRTLLCLTVLPLAYATAVALSTPMATGVGKLISSSSLMYDTVARALTEPNAPGVDFHRRVRRTCQRANRALAGGRPASAALQRLAVFKRGRPDWARLRSGQR